MYRKNLRALIGLAGAVSNNGKTDDTDAIVRQALLHMHKEDLRQHRTNATIRIIQQVPNP